MAIFIVDQFSLNTDLPLDIRYLPSGGSYLDVSLYWYPGMQVYQTSDQKIWYADNSLNWHPISEGEDASLNQIFNLVNDLSIFVNQIDASVEANTALLQIHEASIGDLSIRVSLLESSVNYLTNWNESQDASISDLRSRVDSNESSIGYLTNWNISQDASIIRIDASLNDTIDALDLFYEKAYIDGSLVSLQNWNTAQDASISELRTISNIHDSSIGFLTDWNSTQDASIDELRSNIESSLGLYVLKSGDTMTGPLVIDSSLLVNGNATVTGDLGVRGNLVVDGSTVFIDTAVLDISTNFIVLNSGLTGPPPSWLQSGLVIERGDSSSYAVIFDETDQTFRVGVVNGPDASGVFSDLDTQAVATRQDHPISDGIAIWNSNQNRFDTFSSFTYNVSDGLYLDGSLKLNSYAGAQDLMLIVDTAGNVLAVSKPDASLNDIYAKLGIIDSSITYLTNLTSIHEASIGSLTQKNIDQDTSISNLDILTQIHDISIGYLDSSIQQLFNRQDTSVLGAINIGDGSAGVFAGLTNDGSLQFREFIGIGKISVAENADLIEISTDAEINTASNIGNGEGLFAYKLGEDLAFKSVISLDPSNLIITSDASNLYLDISLGGFDVDASLSGLEDTSINEIAKVSHQIIEWDASIDKWINTNNIFWDISLGTTTDDVGGIPAGTNLNGLTLKEILYKLLYEYQVPTLLTGTDPISGIYEKGLVSTQFSSIDVSYYSTNVNYPLALLNNVHIDKTGIGSIYDASLGLVASASGSYNDATGITNWGGVNRTISYNVTIDDDQSNQSQPAIGLSKSFTFYYRQFWGEVDGNTNIGSVDSSMILTLDSSRLEGETDLLATFTYTSGPKIKYLFAYPDTIAAPDNFGLLSQILDQNDFDITNSWNTANKDVSIGLNNVRYRVYLLKNKVDTPTFNITFKF